MSRKNKILASLFFSFCLISVFQNCSSFKSSSLMDRSVSSLMGSDVLLRRSLQLSFASLNQLSDTASIDLGVYFDSSKIPLNSSRHSVFQTLKGSPTERIVLHTKFTQADNYEIFVITDKDILLRYEVSPEIFGGQKNAARRFAGANATSNGAGRAVMLPPNGAQGAFWFKRFVTKQDINKVVGCNEFLSDKNVIAG